MSAYYYDSGERPGDTWTTADASAWADRHARNFFATQFDELFSGSDLSFQQFLFHVDSFLQDFTLGADDAEGSSRSARRLDTTFCSEALGSATVTQPLVVQAPALLLGVEAVRRHDQQQFVLSGGFYVLHIGHDPVSGLPHERYLSDQLGYVQLRGATAAGPVCLEAKQLPHKKQYRFGWPTLSLAQAPQGLTWLRGHHTILHGKSGSRYVVSIMQQSSSAQATHPREGASAYFVPTPKEMSASVTWSLRFYRVGQWGLDLGRAPPFTDDENVAPSFYLTLKYSLGQHYFFDELFNFSTEHFHAVVIQLDDFLQLYTLGLSPQRTANPGVTSCVYRRVTGFRLLGGECTAPSPLRLSLPALALETRIVQRYTPKEPHPAIRSELILRTGETDRDLDEGRSVVSKSPCAGPASLQVFDNKGNQASAKRSSGPRCFYRWPTPEMDKSMKANSNRHAETWVKNVHGAQMTLIGKSRQHYWVQLRQETPVDVYASQWQTPPTSIAWIASFHLLSQGGTVPKEPAFCLSLCYELPRTATRSPFDPGQRS